MKEAVMKRIEKFLVPTDLSDNSRRGLLYACALAAENHAAVTVVHVAKEFAPWECYSNEFSLLQPAPRRWPADRVVSEASLDLNRFLEPHLEALSRVSSATKRVVLGPIPERIVTVAEQERADMIVMSPRRYKKWGRPLRRSITEQIMHMSPCPVLSVTAPLPSQSWRGGVSPIFLGWAKQRTAGI
jgi:nucleotide-binding universal stress UspA family protein